MDFKLNNSLEPTIAPKNKHFTFEEKQLSWANLMDSIENEQIEIKKQVLVDKVQSINVDELQVSRQNFCEFCNIPYYVDSDGVMFCNKCGLEFKDTTGTIGDDLPKQAFTQMKIFDSSNRNRNQKSLFRSTANYEQYQTKHTLEEFIRVCSQGVNGRFITKSILVEANKVFQKIRSAECRVFRKYVKLGLMSACVSYVMAKNNISRPPTEISQQFHIEHKFHSRGDTLIQQMIENGVIEGHTINPILDYIKMYIELLKIDTKYVEFVAEIIEKAESQLLHVMFDSKNNTKCIGAIWFLIDRLSLPITKEHVAKVCDISKATFFKYYMMICTYYKMFVPVFVKYKIPLKEEWKQDVYAFYGKTIHEQKKPFICSQELKISILKKPVRKRQLVMNFGLTSPRITPTQTPRLSCHTPISIISGASLSRRSSVSSNFSIDTQLSMIPITKTYKKRVSKKIIILPDEQLATNQTPSIESSPRNSELDCDVFDGQVYDIQTREDKDDKDKYRRQEPVDESLLFDPVNVQTQPQLSFIKISTSKKSKNISPATTLSPNSPAII